MEAIKKAVASTHSKIIIGIIVALIALYGGFMWGKKSAQAPAFADEEEVTFTGGEAY